MRNKNKAFLQELSMRLKLSPKSNKECNDVYLPEKETNSQADAFGVAKTRRQDSEPSANQDGLSIRITRVREC